jgi:hypothetical protein
MRGLKRLAEHWPRLIAVPVLLWVGYGSYLAAEELIDGGTSSADPADPGDSKATLQPVPEHELIDAEPTKPRFQGELLGLYLGPTLPPDLAARNSELRTETETCTEIAYQPANTAQRFNLAFTLPQPFVLDAAATRVAFCETTGSELAVLWEYVAEFQHVDDGVEIKLPGRLSVIRSFPQVAWQADVAAERVSVITPAGHQAILLAPVVEDTGYGSGATVIFPEAGAITTLSSNNVPREDLLVAAEAVAKAFQTRAE